MKLTPRVMTVKEMMSRMRVGGTRVVRSEKAGQSSSQLGKKSPESSANLTTSSGVQRVHRNGKFSTKLDKMGGYKGGSTPESSIDCNQSQRNIRIIKQTTTTEEDQLARTQKEPQASVESFGSKFANLDPYLE